MPKPLGEGAGRGCPSPLDWGYEKHLSSRVRGKALEHNECGAY